MITIKANVVKRDDGSCDIFYSNGIRLTLLEDAIHFRKLSSWESLPIKEISVENFIEAMTGPQDLSKQWEDPNIQFLQSKRFEWFDLAQIEV